MNIAECRKDLDSPIRSLQDGVRQEPRSRRLGSSRSLRSRGGQGGGGAVSRGCEGGDDKAATAATSPDAKAKRRGSVVVAKALDGEAAGGGGNRRGSVMAPKDLPDEAVIKRAPMVRRRLHLDNQQDLQDWLAKCNLKTALKSRFLELLNKGMIKASKQHGPVLDHVETDIRQLPTPCTRAHIESIVDMRRRRAARRANSSRRQERRWYSSRFSVSCR